MKFKALCLMALTFAGCLECRPHYKRCRHSPSTPPPCERQEEYDPYQSYYPHCLIYQDSKVQNVTNEDGENYWPGKRDDDFIDSLTR